MSVALLAACSSGVEADSAASGFVDTDGPSMFTDGGDDPDADEGGSEGGSEGESETETDTGDEQEDPGNLYCDATADWNPDWANHELELIALINAARIEGRDCGDSGEFPPAPELLANAALTCASRVHSLDMADRNFFEHDSPEGNDPTWRLGQAGFEGNIWAELIGAGFPTPAELAAGWLSDDSHCGNLMNPDFAGIGVGYAFGPNATYAHYWTLMMSD